MNPIPYLLLITIGGGILAIILAVALVIFIVGFVGWLVTVVPLFSQLRKDSIVQRSAAAEWMQRAALLPKRFFVEALVSGRANWHMDFAKRSAVNKFLSIVTAGLDASFLRV